MRAMLLTGLLAAASAGAQAQAVTERECNRDRGDFHQALEHSREQTLARIDAALAAATEESEREHLRAEAAEAWHEEERMRGFGDTVWRDCMRHVRGAGAAR